MLFVKNINQRFDKIIEIMILITTTNGSGVFPFSAIPGLPRETDRKTRSIQEIQTKGRHQNVSCNNRRQMEILKPKLESCRLKGKCRRI